MLQELYYKTLSPFTEDSAHILSCWHELSTAYKEQHRFYHNLNHLTTMVHELQEHGKLEMVSPAFLLALFYHDAVYNPKALDNEIQSITLMKKHLKPTSFDAIDEAATYIEATISHTPTSNQICNLFLDLDICILGKPWDVYEQYSKDIRLEYGHMNDAEYRTGRLAVLEKFLARERLFITEDFHVRFEEAARENLKREMLLLQE